jgi:hypothetical protein
MFTQNELAKIKSAIKIDMQNVDIFHVVEKLKWASALQPADSKNFIIGMIFVYSHFFDSPEPAIAAAQWRITQDVTDAHGCDPKQIFDFGYNLINE